MAGRNLNIQVAFRGVNQFSGPVEAARKSAGRLAGEVRSTQTALRNLSRNASAFDRLTAASKKTADQLSEARKKNNELRASYGPLKQRTDEQNAAIKAQRSEVRKLIDQQRNQNKELTQLRGGFYRYGVSVGTAGAATDQIRSRTEQYNQVLSAQEKRLAAVNKARSRYADTVNRAEKLSSAGMKVAAGGAAVTGLIGAGLRQYSNQEDAMKGVSRQVSPLRDSTGARTSAYSDMQNSIMNASENLPLQGGFADYAALVEGGARMGVNNSDDPYEKQKADLLSFAETSAMAAKAFELPADQLAEDMGKIRTLYKIPVSQIRELGDTLNWLDDNAQSKGSDIIDVMLRTGGAAEQLGYKNASALSSTFLTFGETAETAGSAIKAMVRELGNAEIQPDRFQAGIETLGLNAKKLQQGMAKDAMGTIEAVLDKVKGFDKDQQLNILTQLFGDEYAMAISKVANNLPELRRQLKLTQDQAAKGSMKRESDIDKDSISSQMLIARTAVQNTAGALTEPLRAALIPLIQMFTVGVQRVRAWAQANPQLATTLIRVAAGAGILLTVGGAVMMMFGAILGPIAALRLGLSTLAGNGGIGMLASGLLRAGGVIQWLVSSPFGMLLRVVQMVFVPLASLIAGLGLPLWAIVAIVAAVVIAIIKFWEPIKAFFTGFFDGLMSGLQPVFDIFKAVFEPLAPLFDLISTGISKVVGWFKDLLTPIEFSSGALKDCTDAGKTFGEVVAKAISLLLVPLDTVIKGITWVLEKLDVIPDKAEKAAAATKKAKDNLESKISTLNADLQAVTSTGKMAENNTAKNGVTGKEGTTSNAPPADTDALIKTGKDAEGKEGGSKSKPDIEGDGSSPKSKNGKGKGSDGSKGAGGHGVGSSNGVGRIGSAMPKITDSLDKISGNTAALRDKPGEIVFKNKQPWIPVRGGYSEPVVRQAQQTPSLTGWVMQQATKALNTVMPWKVEPPAERVPVSSGLTPSAMAALMPGGDVFNINVNVSGGSALDEQVIARRVREELEAAKRVADRRRRSRFTDA